MNSHAPIVIASCQNLPSHEHDDRYFVDALEARGHVVVTVPWDDASFDWSRAAACLPRTTWDYTLHLDAFRTWIDRVSAETQLFNEAALIRPNLDKRYLRTLEDKGVAIVPTLWLDAPADPNALLREQGWEVGFLKPSIGAGSELTYRLVTASGVDQPASSAASTDARQALNAVLERGTAMLQPYLSTVESRGEVSVISIGGALSHAVRKTPVPGDYRVQDDFGAHDEAIPLDAPLREVARRVLSAAGASNALYARVDLLEDQDGSFLLVELELVEPSLFFRHDPSAAERLAIALDRRIEEVTR